ncbi:MAG: hypothetical protein WA228_01640, partial [Desulfobaccales bacterium]
ALGGETPPLQKIIEGFKYIIPKKYTSASASLDRIFEAISALFSAAAPVKSALPVTTTAFTFKKSCLPLAIEKLN